jgi:peptidyl-prolyl cis-trans isomerase D
VDKGKEVKKVQVAIVERKIEPSEETFNKVYGIASMFAGENNSKELFEAAIKKMGYLKKVATNLTPGETRIAGLETPRPIITWAYKAQKDEISKPFTLKNTYVVAMLTEIREDGIAPLEQVKTQVEIEAKKEKKAKQFVEKLEKAGNGNIDAIAKSLNLPVEMATNITFASFQIPNLGAEPQLIAAACTLKKGVVSKPIVGTNGVYVLTVTNTVEAEKISDMKAEKERAIRGVQSRGFYQPYEILKEAAKIEDFRYNFF